MQPLQLPEPTEERHRALETLYRSTREARLRTRAQMVLLAIEQKLTAPPSQPLCAKMIRRCGAG